MDGYLRLDVYDGMWIPIEVKTACTMAWLEWSQDLHDAIHYLYDVQERRYKDLTGCRPPGSWRTKRLRKKRLKALGLWSTV